MLLRFNPLPLHPANTRIPVLVAQMFLVLRQLFRQVVKGNPDGRVQRFCARLAVMLPCRQTQISATAKPDFGASSNNPRKETMSGLNTCSLARVFQFVFGGICSVRGRFIQLVREMDVHLRAS